MTAPAKRYARWGVKAIADHAGNATAAIGWPDLGISNQSFSDWMNGKYDIPLSKFIELVRLNQCPHVLHALADAIANETGAHGSAPECAAKRAVCASADALRAIDDARAEDSPGGSKITSCEKRKLSSLGDALVKAATAFKQAVEQL